MRNALCISEIFDCVIYYLKEDALQRSEFGVDARETRQAGRSALAVLARTCRAFSEPALDALWYRLYSLRPLSLTRHFTLYEATEDEALAWFREEWSLVSRHAPRVRELKADLRNQTDTNFMQDFMQSLWFHDTPLLPNLRKLLWWHDIAPIRWFLGPSLIHLEVYLDGDRFAMRFLECYHLLCPNLKLLRFGSCCYRDLLPHMRAVVSRAMSRSKNLTTALCNFTDDTTLMRFASCRHLERFRATLDEFELDLHIPETLATYHDPDHSPFENLRVLELQAHSLFHIIPFLKSERQPFEEVSFRCDVAPTSRELYGLFSALWSPTRQRTLRKIALAPPYLRHKEGPNMGAIDFQVLGLLNTFNLFTLDVDMSNPVTLTDEELARLAQAWPRLEKLRLTQQGPLTGFSVSNVPTTLTLKGLLLVVEQCPRLHDLSLCVDARNIPSLSDAESSIHSTALTCLSVTFSSIQESGVERVAQFLLEHFPALSRFYWWANQSMWHSVVRWIEETRGYKFKDCKFEAEFENEI